MKNAKYFPLVLLTALVSVLSIACLDIGAAAPNVPAATGESAPQGDRTNCDEILGTVFRSVDERAWYDQNCSRWPPIKVSDAPVVPASTSPAQDQQAGDRCAQIRGRPYESNEQRQWYVQNCQGQPVTGNDPLQAGSAPPAGDRTNCDEIRGTPYRSPSERGWFQQNCGANAAGPSGDTQAPPSNAAPPPQNPPSLQQQAQQQQQNACVQIATRGYRNAQEREYYLRYCR